MGVVHCDLKPENLMLSSKNEADAVIKLVDFGCTHLLNTSDDDDKNIIQNNTTLSNTPRPRSSHTPAYCPPEVLAQLRKDRMKYPTIEPAFDAWSLGVILYTMLVGVHPFDPECDASDAQIEERILSRDKYKPPLRGAPETQHLSDDAISLIEGLMEYDPNKRRTMGQVLQNPWVMGETASSNKMEGSDKRLALYRRYKTKIGSTFFKALLSQADSLNHSTTSERVSLLESAFRRLDTDHKGVLKASSIAGVGNESEEGLSYSDVSSLLSDNMKNRYFEKGCVLYNMGDTGDCLYLIDSGTVEFTTADGFKKQLRSGELVGEELMRDANAKYSGIARCVTPVHALAISRELFNKYVSSDEDTFLNMAERYRYRRRERASTVLRMNTNRNRCSSRSYGKNDVIFKAGDEGKYLYLVEDGQIDISVRGHKVRTLKPGEMTGEHAAFLGKPYNVTARCVGGKGCKVQAMDSKFMHSLFRADPSLGQDFRELVLRRDFKKALCAEIGKPFPTTEEEIRAAFESIDFDRSGAIKLHELRSVVQRFDPTYDEADIKDMLRSLDLNDSGTLTWKEFHRIFVMDMES